LKWLEISNRSYGYHRPGIDEEDSTFLMDAVFVKVFSLMKLERLTFDVDTARVIPPAPAYSSYFIMLKWNTILVNAHIVIVCC
jgi:hypothetical protein